jgi:hypothetical protein
MGNVKIATKGTDYILSLIPNGVQTLELYLDSINADNNLGQVLAHRLNEIPTLKKLKISLILSGITEQGWVEFFKTHKLENI